MTFLKVNDAEAPATGDEYFTDTVVEPQVSKSGKMRKLVFGFLLVSAVLGIGAIVKEKVRQPDAPEPFQKQSMVTFDREDVTYTDECGTNFSKGLKIDKACCESPELAKAWVPKARKDSQSVCCETDAVRFQLKFQGAFGGRSERAMKKLLTLFDEDATIYTHPFGTYQGKDGVANFFDDFTKPLFKKSTLTCDDKQLKDKFPGTCVGMIDETVGQAAYKIRYANGPLKDTAMSYYLEYNVHDKDGWFDYCSIKRVFYSQV